MKRNLKYWTRTACNTALVELTAVLIGAVIMALTANGIDWALLISTLPVYLAAATALFMLVINFNHQVLYFPLLLSMGETRRNAFWGSCYFRLLVIAATVAMCSLVWLIVPDEISAAGIQSLFDITVVLVGASSLGDLFGVIYVKWKWVGTLLLASIGGVVGGTSSILLNNASLVERGGIISVMTFLQKLPPWSALVAAGLLCTVLFLQWLLLRRQEVKF